MQNKFQNSITTAYKFAGEHITLGAAVHDGMVYKDAPINIPLSTFNRHGLVTGATGTGKTKTLQKLSEQLSAAGVPVLVMDVKGDFSGIARPGALNAALQKRQDELEVAWSAKGYPVEFLSISGESGVKMRATVLEFGPVLFSKMLGLNDTQSSVVSLIFKYCDDNGLLLLDLNDFKRVLQYLTNEGRDAIKAHYGAISPATTATIMRKVIELEEQNGDVFFGEPSFDVRDLLAFGSRGEGKINIFRVGDMQDRPLLYSTFMLSLLSEIYNTMPEEGDVEIPKLAIFIDEAHLIFNSASQALLTSLNTIIKLIRSKGIAIIFCTQNPSDVPSSVLGQLGLKIGHALRAFTALDRRAIKLAAENYPVSEYYKTEDVISNLPTGDALVSAIAPNGAPTPLVICRVSAPQSRMDTLTAAEVAEIVAGSRLVAKYSSSQDPESAYEALNKKVVATAHASDVTQEDGVLGGVATAAKSPVGKFILRQVNLIAGQIFRSAVRGAMGTLLKGKR